MKKRILVALTALLLAAGIVVAAATPTQAHNSANGWFWCQGVPNVCVAEHHNGGGQRWFLNTGIGYCRNIPVNDIVSSIDNHMGVVVQFWENAGCRGGKLEMPAGPYRTLNIQPWTGFQDAISSYCVGYMTPSQCGIYGGG